MNKKAYKKNGSLLLEALLSILILSTSISLIIQAMTSSLRATRFSADYTEALILVENKMIEALSDNLADIAEDSYSRGLDGKYVFGETFDLFVDDVSPEMENESNIINHVLASVSWQSGSKKSELAMHTLMISSGE